MREDEAETLIDLRTAVIAQTVAGILGVAGAEGAAFVDAVADIVVLANSEVADNLGVALLPSIPLFASVGGAGVGFLSFLSPANGASA